MNEQLQLQFGPIPDHSIESCGNCLMCMNRDNQFAYCIELNKSVNDLDKHCNNWERNY